MASLRNVLGGTPNHITTNSKEDRQSSATDFDDDEDVMELREVLYELKQARSMADQIHMDVISDLTKKMHTKKKNLQFQYDKLLASKPEPKHMSLHSYAECLKKGNAVTDSGYIVLIQSQLCQKLHMMGMLEHQSQVIERQSRLEVDSTTKYARKLESTKGDLQQQLLNLISLLDSHVRETKQSYHATVSQQEALLKQIEDQLPSVILEEDEEEEEDDAEEDENDNAHAVAKREAAAARLRNSLSLSGNNSMNFNTNLSVAVATDTMTQMEKKMDHLPDLSPPNKAILEASTSSALAVEQWLLENDDDDDDHECMDNNNSNSNNVTATA